MYPSKHGAHAGHKKLENISRFPLILQEKGYETVAVSNNAWVSESFGFEDGFERFFKGWQFVQSETNLGEIWLTNEGREKWMALLHELTSGNPIENIINAIYGKIQSSRRSDKGAKYSNNWIAEWLDSRDKDRPFFLFINYLEPHLEYSPPKKYANNYLPEDITYEEALEVPQKPWEVVTEQRSPSDSDYQILRSLYNAEIEYVDDKIGEIKSFLADAGKLDNTLFLITGDHGENIGEWGMMDHQYCLYDTLIHVPLIISGGSFSNGEKVDQLVQLPDIPVTILDELGIDAPEFRDKSQGISFHPNSNNNRNYVISEYMAPQPSIEAIKTRVGDPHNVISQYDRSLRSIRDHENKLIRGSDGSKELYSVYPSKPEERITNPGEKKEELEKKLNEWISSFESTDHNEPVSMEKETKDRLEDLGYLQ
jgi:arylsulfatase A-like enzyme